jgi:hypothetical protein
MRHRILSLVLCIIFTKLSFGKENHFVFWAATQDSIAMNYISNMPFSNKTASSQIYIWPNPAKDKITVYVTSVRENEQGECVVYNNDGTPVLMHPVRNGTNEIILGNIRNGIYIVAIDNKKKDVIVKRFVVLK